MSDAKFFTEQLSDICFKVVENDPYGQYPFLYVVVGSDKCILIDTGCGKTFTSKNSISFFSHFHSPFLLGSGDYLSFLDKTINLKRLPYFVICTHIHFVSFSHFYLII